MSLEQDIHALTTAINALTQAIGQASRASAAPVVTVDIPKVENPVTVERANEIAEKIAESMASEGLTAADVGPGAVATLKPKPKRKRRTKAEIEAAKAAEAAEPTPEPEPVKEITYDGDLRPRVAKFANAQPANERRAAMVALFGKVDMPNGTELAKNPQLWGAFSQALDEVGY